MKFGDFLETHLVSEWRSQYLDYNKGKFKLGKLATFLETSTECSCQPDENTKNAVRGSASLLDEEDNLLNSDTRSVLYGKSRAAQLDYQLHNPLDISYGSTLQEQQPQDTFDYYKSYNSDISDEEVDVDADEDFKVVSLMDRINYPAARQNDERSRLLTVPKQPQRQRSHSTSVLYMRGMQPLLTSENSNITTLAKRQFLDWVNVEVLKVESFYKSKEAECSKRYFVLLDQLAQLKEHGIANTPTGIENHRNCHQHSNKKKSKIMRSFDIQKKIRSISFTRRFHFIVNYFDLPSFPSYFWLQNRQQLNQDDAEYDELVNALGNSPSSLLISRYMIKKAICELYHTLELLNSFRAVNKTAFRKLIKKFDKRCHESKLDHYKRKVENMDFSKSHIVSKLTQSIEDIYTNTFEEGHRKTAIAKLRSFDAEKSHYASNFISGYLIGISCPLLVLFVIEMYNRCHYGPYPDDKYVLQLWGSWFLFIFTGLLFAVNCSVWDKYRINYKLVFELNPQDALDYKQFLIIPSTLLFAASIIAFFSTQATWSGLLSFPNLPYLYFYLLIAVLFCPLNIFHLRARIWFIASIFRLVLSGFYPVEFRDFFMGVMSCSLTYSIANIYLLFCLSNVDWQNCISCGPMKSYLLGACACIPPLWRSMQCLRRFLDTGEWFPHFANLAKYLITTSYFFLLCLYRVSTFRDSTINADEYAFKMTSNSTITIIFISISTINSVYSSFWDICMDWSLMQFDSGNYLLRDVLIYKKKLIYYLAMILDVFLRFQWIVYVFTPYRISHSALTAFCVAIAELLRRFMWMFFRMENEHASNVNIFRVSRVCTLPYSSPMSTLVSSKILNAIAQDLLGKNLSDLFLGQHGIPIPDIMELEDNVDAINLARGGNDSEITRFNGSTNGYLDTDLEATRAFGDETDLNDDALSIYSTATHYTRGKSTSGWQALSKIVSRAHAKEFQQRSSKTTDRRNSISVVNDLNVPDANMNMDEELSFALDSNS